jgi:hypothetical protein
MTLPVVETDRGFALTGLCGKMNPQEVRLWFSLIQLYMRMVGRKGAKRRGKEEREWNKGSCNGCL